MRFKKLDKDTAIMLNLLSTTNKSFNISANLRSSNKIRKRTKREIIITKTTIRSNRSIKTSPSPTTKK